MHSKIQGLKRITAIILLLIFAYNVMGGYMLIIIQRHQVRREMVREIKKGISLSELTSITMTSKNKKDFDWKDKHEFKFEGVMYDVVSIENVNHETTIYHCISDHEEMKLLTELEAQKNKDSKNNRNNPLKQFVKLVFIEEAPKHNLQFISTYTRQTITIKQVNFYNSRTLDIKSPPPNFI